MLRWRYLYIPIISAFLLALSLNPVAAQTTPDTAPLTRPSLQVTKTQTPPKIDGQLDDPAWQNATVFDNFVQVDPNEGATPTERTEVRIMYDADNLYIAVRCFDQFPDQIVAKRMQRDAEPYSDDYIAIMLDTFADRRNGYFFQMTPAGGRRDGLTEAGRRPSDEWDGLWDGKATIDEHGWAIEIAIPFTTVSFNPNSDTWGFNIEREVRRNNEKSRWASPNRNAHVSSPADGGTLTGLTNLKQGLGLTVKPYTNLMLDILDNDAEFTPGLDIFYNITPSITASLTLNTDFAETEVDEQTVNLTRFPLFFPEKRDFFLQDAGVFNFGGLTKNPLPYFSRRIGIASGHEKEILVGAKVTGRHEALRFGFLDVQMKDDDDLGSKNLAVGRVSLDVLEESTVGMIFTNGHPSKQGENSLVGVDYNYRKTNQDGSTLRAHTWAQTTHTQLDDQDYSNQGNYAVGGRLDIDADPWEAFFFTSHVGEGFDPALGFVSRRGRRRYILEVEHSYRPSTSGGVDWLRKIQTTGQASVYTTLDHEIESASFEFPELIFMTEQEDYFGGKLEYEHENLFETFEIVDDVVIPVGKYDTLDTRIFAGTARSNPVSVKTAVGYGEFFTGDRLNAEATLTLTPSSHFYTSAEYEESHINLNEGDFIVRILRTRVNFIFTPDLSWNTSVQWDNQSDKAGVQSRIRYEYEPGQEIFVVYRDTLLTDDGAFASIQREVHIKFGMTFRF